ncbi:MAG: hypothetical protein ACR2HP_11255, partial [Ilumatobacteraceae bacterium]
PHGVTLAPSPAEPDRPPDQSPQITDDPQRAAADTRPDRTIELRRPDGTIHFTGTTVDRAPHGVTPDPPPAEPDRPPDQSPLIPGPPPWAADRAGDMAPPPRAPWQPNPSYTEIPAHLIAAALRQQAASDQPTGPRTQQAQIAQQLIHRINTLHHPTGSAPEPAEPTARAPAA